MCIQHFTVSKSVLSALQINHLILISTLSLGKIFIHLFIDKEFLLGKKLIKISSHLDSEWWNWDSHPAVCPYSLYHATTVHISQLT